MNPVVVAVSVLVVLWLGLAVAVFMSLRRYLGVDFDEWDEANSVERKRAYLRHPSHRPRCRCGRYGFPFELDVIVDNDLQHTKEECQLWG